MMRGLGCLPFGKNKKICNVDPEAASRTTATTGQHPPAPAPRQTDLSTELKVFTYEELAAATRNFRHDHEIGEGGFGRVYKGRLESLDQVVAIKKLDTSGSQGNREFFAEVLMLSLLGHRNLVSLIGYCAVGNNRLLVYQYMPLGSLEAHLYDLRPNETTLDWNTRMMIAADAAKGLNYLHRKAVIYRDFKTSNILLGEGFHAKLSDFGLAKFGPTGDMSHVSTRVVGTFGYCAPEYISTGRLTFKCDIYSYGIVLLELITGRKALDETRGLERSLVQWARPLMSDRRRIPGMADPRLQGHFSVTALRMAVELAALCVREEPANRPSSDDLMVALEHIMSHNYSPTEPQGTAHTETRG